MDEVVPVIQGCCKLCKNSNFGGTCVAFWKYLIAMTHVIAHLPPVQQAKDDLAPTAVCSCPPTCGLDEHVPCVSGGESPLAKRRRCDFGFAYVF